MMKLRNYRLAVITYRKKDGVKAGSEMRMLKQCMYCKKLWQLLEVLRDACSKEREKALRALKIA
jgi:hypothetical protein